jgi:tRNA pseudouridine65 synthase
MNKTAMLDILYQDNGMVAINKPHGLLVHRTKIATDATEFAVQLLRDQLGQAVNPIHRLDRKTAGVLLFGLDATHTQQWQAALEDEQTQKRYLAIVRGFFPDKVEVDYPLTNDRSKTQEAFTSFRCLAQSELPIPLGKHQTSRYSLVEALPKTGRMHQIRKHLNHLRHPIIGDRPHGCSKQNKLFKMQWNMNKMLLCAQKLSIQHPVSKEQLHISAPLSAVFAQMQEQLELPYSLS